MAKSGGIAVHIGPWLAFLGLVANFGHLHNSVAGTAPFTLTGLKSMLEMTSFVPFMNKNQMKPKRCSEWPPNKYKSHGVEDFLTDLLLKFISKDAFFDSRPKEVYV